MYDITMMTTTMMMTAMTMMGVGHVGVQAFGGKLKVIAQTASD